ncbi:Uncharacterised protein [Moellerella wisconsensis]|nr:Uncharacterised protein [Moellerella wisconsensis]
MFLAGMLAIKKALAWDCKGEKLAEFSVIFWAMIGEKIFH